MKTDREAKYLETIAGDLAVLLIHAGFNVKIKYDNDNERFIVSGGLECIINVNMSSVKASVVDIFQNLIPVIKQGL